MTCFSPIKVIHLWEHPHGQWPPFHTAALPPCSVPCTEQNSKFTVINKRQNGSFHPTGSRSPDRANKLCRLTNGRAGRPAGSQNKSRPLQAVDSIQHLSLTTKGVSIITTLFGHKAMPLGTQRHSAGRPYTAQP